MSHYTSEQIYPWLYRINDPLGVSFYLAVGSEKALLYDTGHGTGDINAAVREITEKPLTVVLSHGHIDHSCGAYQFNEVLLHKNDFELCREHTAPDYRNHILGGLAERGIEPFIEPEEYRSAGTGNLKPLEPGVVFDLGGLRLEAVEMPGHTTGCVGLLAREYRVLLDGDAANGHIWMFLNESLPLRDYIKMLERVYELDFDTFFPAHSQDPHPKSDFQKYIRAAREASVEKAVPYNTFTELKPYMYTLDGATIVFNERTLG